MPFSNQKNFVIFSFFIHPSTTDIVVILRYVCYWIGYFIQWRCFCCWKKLYAWEIFRLKNEMMNFSKYVIVKGNTISRVAIDREDEATKFQLLNIFFLWKHQSIEEREISRRCEQRPRSIYELNWEKKFAEIIDLILLKFLRASRSHFAL